MRKRGWRSWAAGWSGVVLLGGCAPGDGSSSAAGLVDGAEDDGKLAVEPRTVEAGDELRVEHLEDVGGIGFVTLSSSGLEWVVIGEDPSEGEPPPRVYSAEEAVAVEDWDSGPGLVVGMAYVVPVPAGTEPGDHLVCTFDGILPDEQPAEHCASFEVTG